MRTDDNAHAHQNVGSKKLKCSGEQPACSRCQRESMTCVYSLQKQMGRPKKRQRADDEGDEETMMDDVPLEQFLHGADAAYQGTEQATGPADVTSRSKDTLPPTNFNSIDSMFALDGILQPWTVPGLDWSMSDPNGHASDDFAPDLTRDNSS